MISFLVLRLLESLHLSSILIITSLFSFHYYFPAACTQSNYTPNSTQDHSLKPCAPVQSAASLTLTFPVWASWTGRILNCLVPAANEWRRKHNELENVCPALSQVGGVFFLVLNSQFFFDAMACPELHRAQEVWLEEQLSRAATAVEIILDPPE